MRDFHEDKEFETVANIIRIYAHKKDVRLREEVKGMFNHLKPKVEQPK